MIRLVTALLTALTAFVTASAAAPEAVCLDSIRTTGTDASSPAGLWRTGAGAVFDIVPAGAGSYTLILIDSPDVTAPCPATIGTMTTTGTPGTYEAALSAGLTAASARKKHTCIITVQPGSETMTFTAYRKGRQLNLWRLLPYMFRISVKDIDTRPRGIDGAVRIAPRVRLSQPVTL